MDPVTGSLLALAVGDALGAPLEGMKAGHIQQVFGQVEGYVNTIEAFPDRPGRWRPPGLYTDDTQQALAVAEILAVCGEPDARALADLYVRLAEAGEGRWPFGGHRGTGRRFRQAVEAMKTSENPLECGQSSAGNGAAMRIAPVGLYGVSESEEWVARAAMEFSLLTHHDPRGVSAAVAMALAVWRLARGDAPEDVAGWLPERARHWEGRLFDEHAESLCDQSGRRALHMFSKALECLAPLVREANDDLATRTILKEANACEPNGRIAQIHAGFAPASVVAALYRALTAENLSQGLLDAVLGGGDADTVGAMTGALLGARFGVEAIPEEWLEGLANVEQLRVRARALREREVDWSAWEDYVEMEVALCRGWQDTVDAALASNRKAIDKRRQREAARRAAKSEKAPAPEEPPFAPPPEVWLQGRTAKTGLPPQDAPRDPVEAKKEKALRGRKRIGWKDERREKQRRG